MQTSSYLKSHFKFAKLKLSIAEISTFTPSSSVSVVNASQLLSFALFLPLHLLPFSPLQFTECSEVCDEHAKRSKTSL